VKDGQHETIWHLSKRRGALLIFQPFLSFLSLDFLGAVPLYNSLKGFLKEGYLTFTAADHYIAVVLTLRPV
jgi:hypothetical protein